MNLTNAKCVALPQGWKHIVRVEPFVVTVYEGGRWVGLGKEGTPIRYAWERLKHQTQAKMPDGIYAAVDRECKECEGQGGHLVEIKRGEVSHEMAMDAGEMGLIGQPIFGEEMQQCEHCDDGTTLELVQCEDVTPQIRTYESRLRTLRVCGTIRYLFYTDTEAKVARRC